MARDTGPGNALIDDFVSQRSDKSFDEGGALAATGKVEGGVVGPRARKFIFRPAAAEIGSTAMTLPMCSGTAAGFAGRTGRRP